MKKCPNCKIDLERKFPGESIIEFCASCGYERAITTQTRQTQLNLQSAKQ